MNGQRSVVWMVAAAFVFGAAASTAVGVVMDDFESYADGPHVVLDSAAPTYEGGWINDTWGGGGIAATNVTPLSGTKSAYIYGASKAFTMPIFDGMEVNWLMQVAGGVRGQLMVGMTVDVNPVANAGVAVFPDGTVRYFLNGGAYWYDTGFSYTPGNTYRYGITTHYHQPDPVAGYGTYDVYMENPDGTGRQTMTGLTNGLLWNPNIPVPGIWGQQFFNSGENRAEYDDINQVPEPLTLALLGCGGMALVARRRR